MTDAALIAVVTGAFSALGGGGVVAAVLRYRSGHERLEEVELPKLLRAELTIRAENEQRLYQEVVSLREDRGRLLEQVDVLTRQAREMSEQLHRRRNDGMT